MVADRSHPQCDWGISLIAVKPSLIVSRVFGPPGQRENAWGVSERMETHRTVLEHKYSMSDGHIVWDLIPRVGVLRSMLDVSNPAQSHDLQVNVERKQSSTVSDDAQVSVGRKQSSTVSDDAQVNTHIESVGNM